MNSVNSATVMNASSADPTTAQGAASVSVLKKALSAESAGVATLINALPSATLATQGSVGTQVNTYA